MPVPSSTGIDRFAVKGKSKGKQSKKCRPFPLNGYLGVFSEKNRDLKNRTLQPRRVARTSVLRSKTLAQGGFIPPCAFPITHGFQKEKTRFACLFFLSGGFNSDIFVLEALHRNGFEFSKEFRMRLF